MFFLTSRTKSSAAIVTTSIKADAEPISPGDFYPGREIYLSDKYYLDATVLEIPKYGWKVKAIMNGLARIEYHRPKLKVLISIFCEVKYLKHEIWHFKEQAFKETVGKFPRLNKTSNITPKGVMPKNFFIRYPVPANGDPTFLFCFRVPCSLVHYLPQVGLFFRLVSYCVLHFSACHYRGPKWGLQ